MSKCESTARTNERATKRYSKMHIYVRFKMARQLTHTKPYEGTYCSRHIFIPPWHKIEEQKNATLMNKSHSVCLLISPPFSLSFSLPHTYTQRRIQTSTVHRDVVVLFLLSLLHQEQQNQDWHRAASLDTCSTRRSPLPRRCQ